MSSKIFRIEQLRKNWVDNEINVKACIDFWNTFATRQANVTIPTFEDNEFLKLIKNEGMINKNGTSLDIGCGTGRYSLGLANSFKELIGIDISTEMLKKANEILKDNNINNVRYICNQWNELDLKENGFEKKFDLVFAHMTPAISSLSTFEKMIKASKGYCIMSKPTRREDKILSCIMDKLNVTGFNFSAEDDIKNAFDYLWDSGYCPKFHYEMSEYSSKKSVSYSTNMYINRIKQFKSIDCTEEKEIKDIVESFSQNGEILENMKVMITTIYWHV